MSLTRLTNWETQLAQAIAIARQSTFQWGVFDCALHVSNCILAITGTDPAAAIRGTYGDEQQANAVLATYGGTVEMLAVSFAGTLPMDQVSPTYARRGDLVLVNNSTPDRALGIVDLTGRFALCAAAAGLARVPMSRWMRAWLVG